MSTLRRRVRIVLDGESHEIVTNARDAIDQRQTDQTVGDVLRPLWRACRRLEVPGTPAKFEEFVEILDDMEDLETSTNGSEPGDLDPTQPAVSAT